MSSYVAIVGCSNVGKSTLFNRLTRTQQALVANQPGITRDRLYAKVKIQDKYFTLVDTGGFILTKKQLLYQEIKEQTELAIAQADILLFITDGQIGLRPIEHEIFNQLRRTGKPIICAINKADIHFSQHTIQEFQVFGVEKLHFISAAHGHGIQPLIDHILTLLSPNIILEKWQDEPKDTAIRVALIGRPNVGKSSLANALINEKRMIVSSLSGTTRDTVASPIKKNKYEYLLIDTAGIRRQSKTKYGIETIGVIRTLQIIKHCHIAMLIVDSFEGITDQDLELANQTMTAKRGLGIILNKWDLLEKNYKAQKQLLNQLLKIERFVPWAPRIHLSAKTGKGLSSLLPWVNKIWTDYNKRLATAPLNQALKAIINQHTPPVSTTGQRPKFYYASQVSIQPPTIVIFVNNSHAIRTSYHRYLVNNFRKALNLIYSPLILVFRSHSKK